MGFVSRTLISAFLLIGIGSIAACNQEPAAPTPPPMEQTEATSSSQPAPAQPETQPAPQAQAQAQAQAQGFELTLADIDGFMKGMSRENELLLAAIEKKSAAQTDEEKLSAMMSALQQEIAPQGAEASGLAADRYKKVKESIGSIIGAVDMKVAMEKQYQNIDTTGMDEETAKRARENATQMLAAIGDPFKGVSAEVADSIHTRQDQLAKLRAENIGLMFKVAGR